MSNALDLGTEDDKTARPARSSLERTFVEAYRRLAEQWVSGDEEESDEDGIAGPPDD